MKTYLLTDKVKIGALPISIGGSMDDLYGFGNRWRFKVVLEGEKVSGILGLPL